MWRVPVKQLNASCAHMRGYSAWLRRQLPNILMILVVTAALQHRRALNEQAHHLGHMVHDVFAWNLGRAAAV